MARVSVNASAWLILSTVADYRLSVVTSFYASAPSPRIVAVHGQRWRIQDDGGTQRQATHDRAPASQLTYDDEFQLLDTHTGKPLANVEYAIERASGDMEHGVTDADGRTHRLSTTDSAEELNIHCNGAEHA